MVLGRHCHRGQVHSPDCWPQAHARWGTWILPWQQGCSPTNGGLCSGSSLGWQEGRPCGPSPPSLPRPQEAPGIIVLSLDFPCGLIVNDRGLETERFVSFKVIIGENRKSRAFPRLSLCGVEMPACLIQPTSPRVVASSWGRAAGNLRFRSGLELPLTVTPHVTEKKVRAWRQGHAVSF